MSLKLRLTLLVLLACPLSAHAGGGWFGYHHCPKPSYNWMNYTFPKLGYEWRAYHHPAPADYRFGPYPHAGEPVAGVRWFPCPAVAPAVRYPPPPPSAPAAPERSDMPRPYSR